jgi:hypothetical protein
VFAPRYRGNLGMNKTFKFETVPEGLQPLEGQQVDTLAEIQETAMAPMIRRCIAATERRAPGLLKGDEPIRLSDTSTSQINGGHVIELEGGGRGFIPANWRDAVRVANIDLAPNSFGLLELGASVSPKVLRDMAENQRRYFDTPPTAAEQAQEKQRLAEILVTEEMVSAGYEADVPVPGKIRTEYETFSTIYRAMAAKAPKSVVASLPDDVFTGKFAEHAFGFALDNPCSEDLLKRALRAALDQRNAARAPESTDRLMAASREENAHLRRQIAALEQEKTELAADVLHANTSWSASIDRINELESLCAELSDKRMLAADEAGNHDYIGPTETVPHPTVPGRTIQKAVPDPAHERFHGAIGDVLSGKIIPAARRQMQEALKQAPKDAPTTASTSKPMPNNATIRFGDSRRLGLA